MKKRGERREERGKREREGESGREGRGEGKQWAALCMREKGRNDIVW